MSGTGGEKRSLARSRSERAGTTPIHGTTPPRASKLYEAIRGNGGTARLVMLPQGAR